MDIDLSILGQPAGIYDAYDSAIRLEYAHVPEAAGNVRRLAVHTKELVLLGFFIRLWPSSRRRQHRRAVDVLRRHQDHVVVGLQVALHHALFEDQVEWNPELIECVAVPAQLLSAVPLRVDGYARYVRIVTWNVRHR